MWTSEKLGVILDFLGNFIMAGAVWAWFYQRSKEFFGGWHARVDEAAKFGEKWRNLKRQFSRAKPLPGVEAAERSRLPLKFTVRRFMSPIKLFLAQFARLVLAGILVALKTIFDGQLQVPLFFVGLAMWCWASYIALVHAPW